MARALTPDAFLAALRAEGVRLCDKCAEGGWATHRRAPWQDVVGVMLHHTASNTTPTSLIRNGRPDLRGPLSVAHETRDAVVHLTGYGWCNHAGRIDADVIAAVRAGLPAPPPGRDSVNGNPILYSLEVNGTNDGVPWPPDMVDQAVRFATAICRAHDWNVYHIISHGEATRRKPGDPAGVGMPEFRTLVANRLNPVVPIAWPTDLKDDLVFPILRRGTEGLHVRLLQGILIGNGHTLTVDGDFGPATDAALRRHQAAHQLPETGVADQNDWRTLLRQPRLTPTVV